MIEHCNGKIDLVLLDLVMSGVDGFEVLRYRPQMPAFKDIPVIVLTANESEDFQIKAFELGANEFIIKPVNPSIALSRIDEMTNLYNKVTVEKLVTDAQQDHKGRTFAMLMVDIDNFKAINDTYGHKMGDHVICVIASVLSSYFDVCLSAVDAAAADYFDAGIRNAGAVGENNWGIVCGCVRLCR